MRGVGKEGQTRDVERNQRNATRRDHKGWDGDGQGNARLGDADGGAEEMCN